MKLIKLFLAANGASVLLALTSHAQGTVILNFSSTIGSTIQFNGANSSFQFNPSTSSLFGGVFSGTQWVIGSPSTSSAVGLFGSVSNSPFSYGPITTTVSGPDTIQSAFVTGPLGALAINDGMSNLLTGIVNWIQVSTDNTIGGINASLLVNVTGLAYAGANLDLTTLAAYGSGSMNLGFQFSPGETLSQLTSGNVPYDTSYSGSISAVPEPTSIGCTLAGLGVFFGLRRLNKPKLGLPRQPVR